MQRKRILVLQSLFCLFLVQLPFATAQTDFFWSLQNLNDGAVNGPASAVFAPGETGELYLYYTTNGPSDSDLRTGALLDVTASVNGVIRFTGAQSFDFPITIVGTQIGTRWGGFGAAGETGTVSDEIINEWGAFTFSSDGIREANLGAGSFFDEGYDAAADAFLFGRISFDVIGRGTVNIVAAPGKGLAVDGVDCNATALEPTFGAATISVPKGVLLGDVNLDDLVDLLDVDPFVEVLSNKLFQDEADINRDGIINLLDVDRFVAILSQAPPINPPPPAPQDDLPGDANCDGVINLLDGPCYFAIVLFGESACNDKVLDVNQDGLFDLTDIAALVDLILACE